MSATAEAVNARRGQPLTGLLGAAERVSMPVTLTATQRHALLDMWERLLADVYVHFTQKRSLYGYDPIRALMALRRQIPFLDSDGFLRELMLLVNRLRDQHTQLYVRDPNPRVGPLVAALPFLVEVFGEYRKPSYLVTKVSDDVTDTHFQPGVRLTTWNGVPFARTVDLYADTLTGGRPDARRARALETLTQRPLAFLPPPDELWVEVGYRTAGDQAGDPDRTIRFEWQAIDPAKAATASNTNAARTRRAVDLTSESARRARKLLFQTELWERDLTENEAVAKAAEWMPTTFPDAISARQIATAHGTIGYVRIWTFDVEQSSQLADELARILANMPDEGLIIDLRSNPGGVIDTAERLLQLLTPYRIEPIRFAVRATAAMAAIADADGNGADLADWAPSVAAALNLGEEYSQHLPISDPDRCNELTQAYSGPVVAVVNASTFSCGDIFAAGVADHGIGQVVSIGEATGAGGANVWTSDDIAYAYHSARLPLPKLPAGVSFSIAVRRMARSALSAGLAVEDVGVSGDERYAMTERDLLDGNADLIDFCAHLLTSFGRTFPAPSQRSPQRPAIS